MPFLLGWRQDRHFLIQIIHVRFENIRFYKIAIAMNNMGKGKKYIKMPINPLMAKHALFHKNPMNSRDNSTGHKHNKNVPITFI